jgi:uncharacterized protein YaiI (UPF0178 family)
MTNAFPAATSIPITIYVDADACPVKHEVYRVAARHGIKVIVVSNSPIAVPRDPLIERVVVSAGMDAADNWIDERVSGNADAGVVPETASPAKKHTVRGDIVITADIPLASRCVKAGAVAIAPNGRAFTEESIGMTLATRNLMDSLRSAGEITSGPKAFSARDRSSFLSALDQAIVRLKRAGFGTAGSGH